MNLRRLRYILFAYALVDFLIGYAGFIPITNLAAAQFTTVTGTVTDPNGLPYAFGTISATLVSSASPTLNGFAYTPPTQPTGLGITGNFTMQLADNTVLLPAATKWNFTVCSAAGTVQPVGGKGPVCFSLAAPITISGTSQDISANLNAVALALTNVTTGVQTFVGAQPQITVGANGGTGGQICLKGSASGCANITAPAVAGTNTNPLTVSNVIAAPNGTSSAPAYGFTNSSIGGMWLSAGNTTVDISAGGTALAITSAGSMTFAGNVTFGNYSTNANCQLGGATGTTSPAACGGAQAGSIAIPASQTSYTVNTTAVSAASHIFVQQITDNSGISTATCNAGATTPIQSARVASTSFTITLTSVASVTCIQYWIVD
jgi:hypothetical protein